MRIHALRHQAVETGAAVGAPAEAAALKGSHDGGHPASAPYFEEQEGAWCGMHALNNYMGGPYVTQDACMRAAERE